MKHTMTRPRCPGAWTNRSGVLGEVAHDLAIALRLALPGAPEHGEELAHGLASAAGTCRKTHGLRHVLEIRVEVRAREAEDDADIALREHHRIDQHAAVGVLQGDDQRHEEVASDQPPDDVGAGYLIEHRADDLDPLHRPLLAAGREMRQHLGGHVTDAVVEVLPRRAEAHVAEHVLEEERERAVIDVGVGGDRGGHVRQRDRGRWPRTRCRGPRPRCRTAAG